MEKDAYSRICVLQSKIERTVSRSQVDHIYKWRTSSVKDVKTINQKHSSSSVDIDFLLVKVRLN